MEVHATAVTASQSMPAGQLSMRTVAGQLLQLLHALPFRVRSTFHTCFLQFYLWILISLSFWYCIYFMTLWDFTQLNIERRHWMPTLRPSQLTGNESFCYHLHPLLPFIYVSS